MAASDVLDNIKENRRKYALEKFKIEEQKLNLDQLKELDMIFPGWQLVFTKYGYPLEVALGGTRVRDYKSQKEYKIYYTKGRNGSVGYAMIIISNRGAYRQLVHQLVAKAFCPNDDPEHKTEVNHIDGNKINNCYLNLEWVTHSENQLHAFRTGLAVQPKGEKSPSAKYTDDQIKLVCQLLHDRPDLTFKEIGSITDVSWYMVRCIFQRTSRTDVSQDYEFPPRETRARGEGIGTSRYSSECIENACRLLNDVYLGKVSYTRQEIADIVDISKDMVDKIATGENWASIASKYDFYQAKFGDQAKQVSNV